MIIIYLVVIQTFLILYSLYHSIFKEPSASNVIKSKTSFILSFLNMLYAAGYQLKLAENFGINSTDALVCAVIVTAVVGLVSADIMLSRTSNMDNKIKTKSQKQVN